MVLFFLSDMIADIFYFLDIYSYGKLPPHCEQRFLPCEIGCVRYSLQDGIVADFHHFIDPGEFQESQRGAGVRGRLSGVTAAQVRLLVLRQVYFFDSRWSDFLKYQSSAGLGLGKVGKRISIRILYNSKECRLNPGGPAHVCALYFMSMSVSLNWT